MGNARSDEVLIPAPARFADGQFEFMHLSVRLLHRSFRQSVDLLVCGPEEIIAKMTDAELASAVRAGLALKPLVPRG